IHRLQPVAVQHADSTGPVPAAAPAGVEGAASRQLRLPVDSGHLCRHQRLGSSVRRGSAAQRDRLWPPHHGPRRGDLLWDQAPGRRLDPVGRTSMAPQTTGSITAGMFLMFLISVLLFWLPFVGPFLAGLVGGKKAGGVGNAIAAVFLPGIILAVALLFLATSLTGLPLVGAVAGTGGLILSLAHVGPLLLGAIIGGLIA